MEVTEGLSGEMLGVQALCECLCWGGGAEYGEFGGIKKAIIGTEAFEPKLPFQDGPSIHL